MYVTHVLLFAANFIKFVLSKYNLFIDFQLFAQAGKDITTTVRQLMVVI